MVLRVCQAVSIYQFICIARGTYVKIIVIPLISRVGSRNQGRGSIPLFLIHPGRQVERADLAPLLAAHFPKQPCVGLVRSRRELPSLIRHEGGLQETPHRFLRMVRLIVGQLFKLENTVLRQAVPGIHIHLHRRSGRIAPVIIELSVLCPVGKDFFYQAPRIL